MEVLCAEVAKKKISHPARFWVVAPRGNRVTARCRVKAGLRSVLAMKNTRYAVVAVAAALTLAGCTAASATGASQAATTVASKHTAPPVLSRVTVYSVNTDAPVLSAIVSGPVIGDSGSAAEVQPGSTVPSKHAGELLLKLAHGTFRLNIADIGTKFTKALGPANLPSTCSDYVSVRGEVPIVAGSGTGAYKGVAGSFAATLSVNEVHHVPCTQTVTTYRQLIWLNGAGTVALR